MRRLSIFVFSAICALILFTNCFQHVVGSSQVISINKDITGFDKLDLDYGCQATVTYSTEFSVVIRVNENVEPYLRVHKKLYDNSTLQIYIDPTNSYQNVILEADITMPLLVGIELEEGSRADIDGFVSDSDFEAIIAGGSDLIGNITADKGRIEVSTNSTVTLEGQCAGLQLQASGNSSVDLIDFPAIEYYDLLFGARVQLSSNSNVTITTCRGVSCQLSGNSALNFYGSPIIVIQNSNSVILYKGPSDYCD